MRIRQYFGIRAVIVKNSEDSADVAAFVGTGIELAVGKSSRAAFAEAIIGIRRDFLFTGNGCDIDFPLCGG